MQNILNNHRNYLHTIPERALTEYKTAEYIRETLKKENVQYHEVGTSTIAFIKGESEKCIGFRADIDALPLKEETNNKYKSKTDGMMHACGHDGHTAMLLTFIEEINKEMKNGLKLKKSLLFMFQAAEEGLGGARFIIEDDFYKSKDIEGIFALHVYPEIEEGEFAIKPGFLSLQNINLDIKITGKGCHGAQPHKGIDPILIGAKLIEAYQSIKSRNIPSDEHFLFTIGAFNAGKVRNIVPEYAEMLGTIRLENVELIPLAEERVRAINAGFEIAYGVKIDMEFKPFYPPVINDENLYEKALKALGTRKNYNDIRLGGSEDFSFFGQNGTPILLGLLGIKNEKDGFIHALHNNRFDFNNEALIHGVEYYKNILKEMEVI